MTAITFETEIEGDTLRIPHLDALLHKHVRVVIEVLEPPPAHAALPVAFTRPLAVQAYALMGQRDQWHERV
jgi:hypothetical protein